MWLFLLLISVFWFYALGQKVISKYKKLPPGPIRWPIVGSIPQMMMIDSTYSYKQINGMANKYGPIISLGCGAHYTVVVSSFETMKELFKRPETNSQKMLNKYAEQRNGGENLGIIWSDGETWKELRKLTVKGLRDFGFGKVRSLEDTYKEEVDILLEDIRNEISNTGGIWSVESIRLTIVAINIIWSSVGGYRFDHNGHIIQKHIAISKEIFKTLSATNLLSMFPFLKIFSKWSGHSGNDEMHQRSKNFIQELIVEAKSRRNNHMKPESFIEFFLNEIDKNKDNAESHFSEKQLVTILMDLFLAGTDTTGSFLTWLILYFALDQRVQTKLRHEIQTASRNHGRRLTVLDASRLPYLQCCIYEAFRHSPFLLIPIPRKATADITISDYKVPNGTCLAFNLFAVYHDKSFWGENVGDFYPDRFLTSNGTAIDPVKLEHVPQFGFGNRMCPAESIAIHTIAAVVTDLIANFKIGIAQGREPNLDQEIPSLTISPKPYVVTMEPI